MQYTVILTQESNGDYSATAPSLPRCSVKAKTRDEALDAIRETIAEVAPRSEVVQIDVSVEPKSGALQEETPWEFFGVFKNDPSWAAAFDDDGAQ